MWRNAGAGTRIRLAETHKPRKGGWEAHGTRGGTAKRARTASTYGWSRLGRSLALPAGRRSRAGLDHGPFSRQTKGLPLPRTKHGPDTDRTGGQRQGVVELRSYGRSLRRTVGPADGRHPINSLIATGYEMS